MAIKKCHCQLYSILFLIIVNDFVVIVTAALCLLYSNLHSMLECDILLFILSIRSYCSPKVISFTVESYLGKLFLLFPVLAVSEIVSDTGKLQNVFNCEHIWSDYGSKGSEFIWKIKAHSEQTCNSFKRLLWMHNKIKTWFSKTGFNPLPGHSPVIMSLLVFGLLTT